MLKSDCAYMLRNDGSIFECSSFHPYIKYENRGSVEKSIYDLFTWMPQNLVWFYENTTDEKLKELIQVWVKSIDESVDYKIHVSEQIKSELSLSNVQKLIDNKHDIELYYLHINNQCNQEFLRIRTSGKTQNQSNSQGIYFRVSSNHFNWFNLIWDVVFKNQAQIKNVTICADEYSSKGTYIYKHNGVLIDRLDTNQFLTLSGNPVIESYEKANTTIDTHTAYLLMEFLDKKTSLLNNRFSIVHTVYKDLEKLFLPTEHTLKNTDEETNLTINYFVNTYYELLNK